MTRRRRRLRLLGVAAMPLLLFRSLSSTVDAFVPVDPATIKKRRNHVLFREWGFFRATHPESQQEEEHKKQQGIRSRQRARHRPFRPHGKSLETSKGNRHFSRIRSADFSFLDQFQSDEEICEWIRNNYQTTADTLPATTASRFSFWTSHDNAAFIRRLGDRHAFAAIRLFLQLPSLTRRRKNVYTYTAAIAAFASSSEYRIECWALLEEMCELGIRPSSFTGSAMFQACWNASEAAALAQRLRHEFPAITWTRPLWESAIFACAGSSGELLLSGREEAWSIADNFFQDMRQSGMAPTVRTYLALFYVCAETKNLPQAMTLYKSLQDNNSSSVPMTLQLFGAVLRVCAAVGDDVSALEVLQVMYKNGLSPNVRHCTSYLKALVAAGKLDGAINFLKYMAGDNDETADLVPDLHANPSPVAHPDRVAIQTVLHACVTKGSFGHAHKLLKLAQDGSTFGLENLPDEKFYNLVLGACQEPRQAKEIIREMQLSRRYRLGAVPPTKFSYTAAIKVCRKAKDVQSAQFFLTSAKDNGIEPDVIMYSAAIWAAAGAGDSRAAQEFLATMESNGYQPNVVSYNGVIAACAANGNAADAEDMYNSIQRKRLTPTLTTYFHLAASARKIKDPNERLEMLVRVFGTMKPEEYTINTGGPILEALISTYGSLGRIDDALNIHDSIKGPCDKTILRATTLACSMASPPRWEDAVSLIHTCDIVGGRAPVYVDQLALGNGMIACSKADEWEESLQLFRLYGGSRTPIKALKSLIASCGRVHRPDMAIEILNEMESCGIKPDALSYRNAVIACNQAEHEQRRRVKRGEACIDPQQDKGTLFHWWECALSLLRRMQEDGLQPDIQTYSSVISATEAAGQWQLALGVLQAMMKDESSELNLFCFNAAIAACEKGGAWVEALALFERMKANGGKRLQPNFVTYGSLILAMDRAGQKELAVDFFQEAVKKRIIQPWRVTRNEAGERIRAMDLHRFSAAMARAALRSHLDGRLGRSVTVSAEEDLVIVVGKGLRSEGDPVLLPTAQRVLLDEYGVQGTIDAKNQGRIIVSAQLLEDMIKRKGWR